MQIIKQKTRTLATRDNGRSSDAVSPNWIYGCLGGCMSSYCYVGRFNHDRVYINENFEDICKSITKWVDTQPWPKVPNQVDDTYYCIDIGCSTDVPLMRKHYDWQRVFDFFNEHPKLKTTFATKYPTRFLDTKYILSEGKHRIRVSLMPQKYSDVLEPNTDKIADRIREIPKLQESLEVHINFSPIIYEEGWLEEYYKLFAEIRSLGISTKCECIFLTHSTRQHERNSEEVRSLLWKPDIQEAKNSNYVEGNIRYEWKLKSEMIKDFKELYKEFFDVSSIRYIF